MLHILNGDSLLKTFKHTHLSGDIVIWRECMVEGPVKTDDSVQFWKQRAEFIAKTYNSSPDEYSAKFLRQLHKLDHSKEHTEINLWFEFDLFCQVNMLCALDNIRTKISPKTVICWVTPNQSSAEEYFAGYGNLMASDLLELFENRRKLNIEDLNLFTELWKAYKHDDILTIKHLIHSTDLPFVKEAFTAHLERLPQNGQLNRVDRKLQQILDDGITDEREICLRFWETESIFGFGDLQVIDHLHKLGK